MNILERFLLFQKNCDSSNQSPVPKTRKIEDLPDLLLNAASPLILDEKSAYFPDGVMKMHNCKEGRKEELHSLHCSLLEKREQSQN